ncbi:MAG: PAS domain-containing protein, partial [Bdellovibrionota bacterium]
SSNEELTTLNEELNAKQSELRTLNVSFENVQNSIGSPLIILDERSRVVRYNPESLKLFSLGPHDIGREISRVSSNFEIEDFKDMVTAAITDGISSETIAEIGNSIYQLRILPCLDESRSITGAILIFFDDTQSLKNQQKLAISDARMRAIIDGSDSLVSLKDSWGRYLLVNSAFTAFFGKTEEQIIGQTDRELFSDEFAVPSREADVEVLVTRSPKKHPVSIRSPKGETQHFVASRFPLVDIKSGQAYAVGNVSANVTAEISAKLEVDKSQARYRAIVDDQAVFVARHGPDGRLNFVNDPFNQQFGESIDFIGKPFESIVAMIDRARVDEAIRKITPQDPVAQYEHRAPGSQGEAPKWIKWIHRGIFDQDGKIQEFQAVGFDVSESRLKTDQLIERDSVYSSVFDHTSDFLSVYRVKGGEFLLESFNRTTALAMGSAGTQMVGHNLLEFVDSQQADGILAKYKLCVETRKAQTLDERIEMPGGQRYFATTLVPIPGDNGEIERVAATSRDVSNYKRIEVDLRRAKEEADTANKSKSDFLASMSHELRTPLNVVLGMSQLLADTGLSEEQNSYVNSVHRSGRLLLNLIEDVLDVAKIEAGAITLDSVTFSPADILSEVKEMFKHQAKDKGIELLTDIDVAAERNVIGDPARFRQIVVNLMSNAVKFTDQGSVTMRALSQVDETRGQFSLTLSVKDTGIGISQEAHQRLFKRFSQVETGNSRRYGGSGLGLMISKQLVSMMGGTIEVKSALGNGSTFSVQIPFRLSKLKAEANRIRALAKIDPAPAVGSSLKILAIDDSKDSRELIGLFLKKLGHDATLAVDAHDALTKLTAGRFDIVLMDVQMPKMDGYEATAVIRKLEGPVSEIPVVALTANAMTGDSEKAFRAGMDDYLSKPIDIGALRELLSRWANRLKESKELNDNQ